MLIRDLVAAMESIAPTRYAESWDNVGLLAGDPAQPVTRCLLTIDYTPAVAHEAVREKCDAVVSYHPPLFEAVKRLNAPSLVFDAIRRGIALYSPHTALDVADGGTNDVLADALGMTERGPLRLAQTKDREYKLVVFVPSEHLEKVASAMFDAGAGRIGKYHSCSFRSEGTGTFFGEEGTNPAVGEKGKLEHAPEVKLETVVPIERASDVVRAMRAVHPYEEPAFDLQRLAVVPEGVGIGRVGTLPEVARTELIERVKKALGVEHLLVAGVTEGTAKRAAVCAGAGGEMLKDALAKRVDVYLTGEMRHHDALAAARAGAMVLCALHSNSERATLVKLAERLKRELAGVDVVVSREDRDPFGVR